MRQSPPGRSSPPAAPPPKSRRVRRAAGLLVRSALGHTWAVLHTLFNFALLGLVVLLVSVILREDLPVPGFIRSHLERELAARGFVLAVQHVEVDPTATFLAENVSLAPARFGGAVLSAGRVIVEFDRLKLLAGRVELEQLTAEDLRIICPPSLSPSGEAVTLVQIASLQLNQNAGVWRVPGLVGMLGPVEIIARGTFGTGPAREPPAAPPDVARLLDAFAHYAPRAVRELSRLDALRHARLELQFTGAVGEPVTVDAAFTAAGWRDDRFGTLQGVRAQTHVTLGGDPASAPVRLSARIEHATHTKFGSLAGVELAAAWLAFPTRENFLPWRVHLAAAHLTHPKGTLTAPVVAVFPLAYPLVEFVASAEFAGETVALSGEADVRSRSGVLDVRGRIGREWLARVSGIVGRDVTYYATIDTPPDFAAHATIGPDLKWRRIDFRLLSPPVEARGVGLDRVRVRGHVTPEIVRLSQLEFSRGTEYARGTYASDFHRRDYRLRLSGALRPASIAPWFGPWWGRLWQDYSFHGPPPTFDVDAHGNWLRPEPILVTGSGRAEQVALKGIAFDAVRTRFFLRPNYVDLFDATIRRPEGRVDGGVRLRFERGNPQPVWQQFAFSSNADLVELARIFGPGGEEMLAPYRYSVPPDVTAIGAVTRQEDGYDVRLDIGLNTGDEFRYRDFPLSWLTTRIVIQNRHIELPEIYAGYAGGVLTGSATVDDGQLTFDARLANADFDQATQIYSEFVERNFPSPPEAEAEGSMVRENYGGKLNLELAATGPISDLKAFTGRGTVALSDAQLYRLRVIGVFSDLLGTGIGTLDFTDAQGPFELRRDVIHFPDLRITGNTARLEAVGDYSLANRTIDFRVRMKPLRESNAFLTKAFGLVVDPLTNLLFEARLTGTLRNPSRSVAFLAPRAPAEPESPQPPSAEVPPEVPRDATQPSEPPADRAAAKPPPKAP